MAAPADANASRIMRAAGVFAWMTMTASILTAFAKLGRSTKSHSNTYQSGPVKEIRACARTAGSTAQIKMVDGTRRTMDLEGG